jgi:hypothetical protein
MAAVISGPRLKGPGIKKALTFKAWLNVLISSAVSAGAGYATDAGSAGLTAWSMDWAKATPDATMSRRHKPADKTLFFPRIFSSLAIAEDPTRSKYNMIIGDTYQIPGFSGYIKKQDLKKYSAGIATCKK